MSGTEVEFHADGEIYLTMMPGTRRADDLRRDDRVAIHCPTVDPPEDADSWLGDGKITGRAREVGTDRFRVDLERVVLTAIADGGLRITSWTPAGGLAVVERA